MHRLKTFDAVCRRVCCKNISHVPQGVTCFPALITVGSRRQVSSRDWTLTRCRRAVRNLENWPSLLITSLVHYFYTLTVPRSVSMSVGVVAWPRRNGVSVYLKTRVSLTSWRSLPAPLLTPLIQMAGKPARPLPGTRGREEKGGGVCVCLWRCGVGTGVSRP